MNYIMEKQNFNPNYQTIIIFSFTTLAFHIIRDVKEKTMEEKFVQPNQYLIQLQNVFMPTMRQGFYKNFED